MVIKGTLTAIKNLIVGGNVQVGNSGLVKLADADSSNFINLKAPSTVTSDITLTFPNGVGTATQALTTDGSSGVLSWTTLGGSPAGSGTELQYKNGSSLGAVTNSAVSSSSLSIGTTTTTGAQLTVVSGSTSLPSLKLRAFNSTPDTTHQLGIYDGSDSLKAYIRTDGSFGFPFLTYSATNKTIALSTSGGQLTRGLTVGDISNFETNTQTDFGNSSQNIICFLAGGTSSSYPTALGIVSEDSVGTTGITLTGAKIASIGSHTSGTKTAVYGLEANARLSAAGNATTLAAAVFTSQNTSTATITNMSTVIINSPNNRAGGAPTGTITNNIGLDIKSQYLASSTSYSIRSLGGHAYFETGNANAKGISIRGAGSQASNLLTLEDNSGNPLFVFNGSGYASGQFLNSGFALRDSDSSHKLTITTGSNLTADRSLTFNTGDASRTVTYEGDVNIAGKFRVFKTLDTGAPVVIQGNVIGTTETSILGGTVTIPANFFTVGKMLRIVVRGDLSTTASPPTFRFRVKAGSTMLADTSATSMTVSMTNRQFCLTADLICWSTGASGGIDVMGELTHNSTGSTPLSITLANQGTTIDTTASQNLDVTVQLSSGVTGNNVNTYMYSIQAISA